MMRSGSTCKTTFIVKERWWKPDMVIWCWIRGRLSEDISKLIHVNLLLCFWKLFIFIFYIASVLVTSEVALRKDGVDQNYASLLKECKKIKLPNGTMIQTVPKLLQTPLVTACSTWKSKYGPPLRQAVCRFPGKYFLYAFIRCNSYKKDCSSLHWPLRRKMRKDKTEISSAIALKCHLKLRRNWCNFSLIISRTVWTLFRVN